MREDVSNPEFMDSFAQKLLIIKANEEIQEDILKDYARTRCGFRVHMVQSKEAICIHGEI